MTFKIELGSGNFTMKDITLKDTLFVKGNPVMIQVLISIYIH